MNDDAPVPPRTIGKVPEVILVVSKLGMSADTNDVPLVTRPSASTVTFVYVPADTPEVAKLITGEDVVPVTVIGDVPDTDVTLLLKVVKFVEDK